MTDGAAIEDLLPPRVNRDPSAPAAARFPRWARAEAVAHTARVIGDIIHDHLAVEAGAYVNGSLKRLSKAPADKQAKKADETFQAVKKEIATLQPAGEDEKTGAKT